MSGDKKQTMFAKLARSQQATAEPATPAVSPETETAEEIPTPSPAPSPRAAAKSQGTKRKQGLNEAGKRNHPDYCQANAYVPKAVRRAVSKALLDIDGMDYSSLIEELLKKWLKTRGVSE